MGPVSKWEFLCSCCFVHWWFFFAEVSKENIFRLVFFNREDVLGRIHPFLFSVSIQNYLSSGFFMRVLSSSFGQSVLLVSWVLMGWECRLTLECQDIVFSPLCSILILSYESKSCMNFAWHLADKWHHLNTKVGISSAVLTVSDHLFCRLWVELTLRSFTIRMKVTIFSIKQERYKQRQILVNISFSPPSDW